MDDLKLNRYCCRRMIMTHVDLIEKLLKYVVETSFTYRVQKNVQPLTVSQIQPGREGTPQTATAAGRSRPKMMLHSRCTISLEVQGYEYRQNERLW